MRPIAKPLPALTAIDLMTRDIVRLPEDMPLRDAARLLMQAGPGFGPSGQRTHSAARWGVFSVTEIAGRSRPSALARARRTPLP